MLSPTFLAFRQELLDALARLEPQLDGLRNFRDLQLTAEGEAAIAQTIPWYEERLALLMATMQALDALEAHEYPDVPVSDVVQSVYDDQAERLRTLQIAHAQFAPIVEVVNGALSVSEPEDTVSNDG